MVNNANVQQQQHNVEDYIPPPLPIDFDDAEPVAAEPADANPMPLVPLPLPVHADPMPLAIVEDNDA